MLRREGRCGHSRLFSLGLELSVAVGESLGHPLAGLRHGQPFLPYHFSERGLPSFTLAGSLPPGSASANSLAARPSLVFLPFWLQAQRRCASATGGTANPDCS